MHKHHAAEISVLSLKYSAAPLSPVKEMLYF